MKIEVNKSSLSGEIVIPGSKSHTIRALAIASLAEGTSILENHLMSSDTISCIEGVRIMGAEVEELENSLKVKGIGGKPHKDEIKIDVGNSGTSLRILTAAAALSDKPVSFDGDSSIRKRPMQTLLSALENLGAKVESTNGKCPFTIQGPIQGGKTEVDGISSQFLTALLIASPLAEADTEIEVIDLHEEPYVEITVDWLKKQNIKFDKRSIESYKVFGNQKYNAFERAIPADFSSATFSLCAAAITGSEILIKGLDFADHQGDKVMFDHIEKMGAELRHTEEGVWVKGGDLQGMDIDMNATPDALPAMAVTACFAKGQTRLLNVAQARLKECDRIAAITKELKKMGADITELEDGLVINQSILKGAEVHGYDDHRMVMALAIAGLASEGSTIIDTAESISVTYPNFIKDMQKLGAIFTS